MRKHYVALFILFSGFAFAGSSLPDACTVLTAADVQKVIGGVSPSPIKETTTDYSVCTYSKDAGNNASLEIHPTEGMSAVEMLKQLQQHFISEGKKVTPISDLGEGAFYMEAKNPVTGAPVIITHFGKAALRVAVDVRLNGKHDADAEQKVAKAAYARLP